jgi:hypothetical protein
LLFGEKMQVSLTLPARELGKLFFDSLAEVSLPGSLAGGGALSLSRMVSVAVF